MKTLTRILFVLLAQLSMTTVMAQNQTLLISESDLPYTEETWFAYEGEPIQQDDIVGCWDQGKRIISAAYTSEGWLVILAKNTPYTMQTYYVSADWPEQWIAAKAKEGFVMTSVSRSEKEWLVVLSQGTGITRQMVWRQEWSQLAPWIAENTNKGYCITDLAFDGQAWTVVMSENSKYSSQGYLWANSTQELMELVQREVWGKGFNIHQVEYGAGKYLVVYGNYARGDSRFQNLQISPDEVKEYIREQWAKGICITYVGGGLPDLTVKPVKKRWIKRN